MVFPSSFFFDTFPPPRGERGGVGARSSSSKKKEAAVSAAKARPGKNEINTAATPNGVLTCEIAVF
jgi:hypothetical protein